MANHSACFDALGDPTRRRILERLSRGPLPVGKLASRLTVTRPAVSQHLKVLKDAGLVTQRAVGTRRLYSVDPRGVESMRAWLDRFWDQALAAFQRAVEEEPER
jgi:DNA-binding transcriptional ArsR family regulator